MGALGLCLALFLAGVFANAPEYLRVPQFEEGDMAANALEVERAKQLRSIYGNYSRWGFNHPGPAFFYVYAAAEAFLYDLWHVVPAPYNAHALAGLFLQTLFLGLGLALLARSVRGNLFLPVSIIAAGLFFAALEGTLVSLWPPFGLIGPFFCFAVSGAALFRGRVEVLPLVILSGSFLVHGHVAQPLFVAVLFLLAYGAAFHRSESRFDSGWFRLARHYPRAHAVAAVLLVFFLVPLLIDFTRGSQSNFALVLGHLREHAGDRKGLGLALMYFFSFFGLSQDQEYYFDEALFRGREFFWERAELFGVWLLLGAAAVWVARRRGHEALSREGTSAWPFYLALVALAIFWGMIQDGPPYAFNAYFFFSIVLLALLSLLRPFSAGWRLPNWAAAALLFLAVGIWGWSLRGAAREYFAESEMGRIARRVVEQDPRPQAPKLLLFDHDDWYEAVTVALALERSGRTFWVPRTWQVMFGRDKVFPTDRQLLESGEAVVWRFVRERPDLADTASFPERVAVWYWEPQPLSPDGGAIRFGDAGNQQAYALAGFSTPERDFTWSDEPSAVLSFRPLTAAGDVTLSLRVFPCLNDEVPRQRGRLFLNGRLLREISLTEEARVEVTVPAADWNRTEEAFLRFEFPDAFMPAAVGGSTDRRIIGWGFREIRFSVD